MKIEEKTILWKPVSEYTGGRVLTTNGLDILVGELNPEGDCVSEDRSGILLCGITHFAKIDGFFPELKESEDEKIRKELIAHCKNTRCVTEEGAERIAKWISWLEKRAEQKSTDKVELGKKYKCVASPRYSTFMTGKIYKPEDKFLCSLMNFCSDCFEPIEDGEQKETLCDKCKKEQPSHSCQDITALGRCALEKQCEKPRYSIGDVLCDKSCTTLNKDAQPNFEIVDIRNGMYICDKCSFPISQQDEYELVAKKIEQKPTDEEIKTLLRTEYEKGRADAIAEIQKPVDCTNCTNSKGCINCVNGNMRETLVRKTAWSEEDECYMSECIGAIATKDGWSFEEKRKTKHWLKSLKERYTWKPSDEQMKALHDLNLTGNISYAGQGQVLIELYNDLLKLKA